MNYTDYTNNKDNLNYGQVCSKCGTSNAPQKGQCNCNNGIPHQPIYPTPPPYTPNEPYDIPNIPQRENPPWITYYNIT